MIIAISGSVGSGKTSLARELGLKLKNFEVVHLNEIANEFKIKDVKELQTFDFNIDALIAKINRMIADAPSSKNYIFEGHFAHYINPDLIDFLIVVGRDLKELKKEYEKRGYNSRKIKDNLEVESMNLCFYEGIEEGYKEEEQIFLVENNSSFENMVDKVLELIEKKKV